MLTFGRKCPEQAKHAATAGWLINLCAGIANYDYVVLAFRDMGHHPVGLHWRPDSVAEVMSANGIRNRSELAERLERIGVSRTSVYRSFTEEWQGTASATVLAALAGLFAVPLAQLVIEPFTRVGS